MGTTVDTSRVVATPQKQGYIRSYELDRANRRKAHQPMNTDRILTTHVGSLPRPQDLIELLFAREQGLPYDETAMNQRIRAAVAEMVSLQREVGLDIVNDGEASKVMYSTYAQDRLDGFAGDDDPEWKLPEIEQFPGLAGQFAESRRYSPREWLSVEIA